ncbi:MAG: putative SAND family protein [Streblomastix strix]|uniref:Putative SAND family protein n=1 Tax=Streblomastix strix TaxID=222440 RepID=A0A5J4WR04_9EUKA|nr:MAG: putative SAND family protein [Streblomastix strix]
MEGLAPDIHNDRLLWLEKREARRAREKNIEDNSSLRWQRRRKHVFILTNAAKPIFSKWGDENQLAPFFCVLQALVSFAAEMGDLIRTIETGSHRIVFLIDDPFVFVCVTRSSEPEEAIRAQLYFLSHFLISTVSNRARKNLIDRPQLNIRHAFDGADTSTFYPLMRDMSTNPAFLFETWNPFPLSPLLKKAIFTRFQKQDRPENLTYALLSIDKVVIAMAHSKNSSPLHPADVLVILNTLNTAGLLRQDDTIIPVCLPKLSGDGFLQMYVRLEFLLTKQSGSNAQSKSYQSNDNYDKIGEREIFGEEFSSPTISPKVGFEGNSLIDNQSQKSSFLNSNSNSINRSSNSQSPSNPLLKTQSLTTQNQRHLSPTPNTSVVTNITSITTSKQTGRQLPPEALTLLSPLPLCLTLLTTKIDEKTTNSLRKYADDFFEGLREKNIFLQLMGEVHRALTPMFEVGDVDFEGLDLVDSTLNRKGTTNIVKPQPLIPQRQSTPNSVQSTSNNLNLFQNQQQLTQSQTPPLQQQDNQTSFNQQLNLDIREPTSFTFSFSFFYPFNTSLPIQIPSTSASNPGTGVGPQATLCPQCPNCWHFIFIHTTLRQHIQSGIAPPYHTWKGRRRLLQLYQRTFSKIMSDAQGTACQSEYKARIEHEQNRDRLLRMDLRSKMGMQYESGMVTQTLSSQMKEKLSQTTDFTKLRSNSPSAVFTETAPASSDHSDDNSYISKYSQTRTTSPTFITNPSPFLLATQQKLMKKSPQPNIVNDNQSVIKGRQPSDKLDPDVTARLLELSQPNTFEKATGIYTPMRPPAPCSAASASFASVKTQNQANSSSQQQTYIPYPLISFYYASRPSSEITVGASVAGFADEKLLRTRRGDYGSAGDLLGLNAGLTQTTQTAGQASIGIEQQYGDAILMAVFDPKTKRSVIMEEMARLADWIKREDERLFLKRSAMW